MILDKIFDALLNALGKKIIAVLVLLSMVNGVIYGLRHIWMFFVKTYYYLF